MTKISGYKLSDEDAFALVMAGLRGDAPLAGLCCRHGVSETTYYKPRDRFINAARQGMRSAGKSALLKPRMGSRLSSELWARRR